MSIKSIRNMQIQEFLNRDKNIASIVSDAVRRGVSRFEQVVDPARREQLNMLEIQNVGEYINQIKIKLTSNTLMFFELLPFSYVLLPGQMVASLT
jgi:predicted transcriptional regulator